MRRGTESIPNRGLADERETPFRASASDADRLASLAALTLPGSARVSFFRLSLKFPPPTPIPVAAILRSRSRAAWSNSAWDYPVCGGGTTPTQRFSSAAQSMNGWRVSAHRCWMIPSASIWRLWRTSTMCGLQLANSSSCLKPQTDADSLLLGGRWTYWRR